MMWMVKLPLGERPRLVNYGVAEHGFRGVEEYELPKLWCLHLYFYDVEMTAGGQTHRIVPGSLTLTPPRTRIAYKYAHKRHRHFFVHFAMAAKAPHVAIPYLQHVPDGQDEIFDRLQNIQRIKTYNTVHAEILFWGLLWDIAEAGRRRSAEKSQSSLLEAIDAFVEERLPAKLTVSDVAQHVGLSAVHVNRVVKGALGITTIQLIKKRSLQRAYRLLLHSTMPIKLIALECGIEDLQQFNKLMRGSYGKSPRELRGQASVESRPTWLLDRE